MDFTLTNVLIGLLVGFFVGLTGVGGGVLLAPVLILMGIQPSVAVGTDLVYGTVTKFVGTLRNIKERRVDWSWTFALALGSVPAGLAGSFFIGWLRGHYANAESILLTALGAVLAFAALVNIVSELRLVDWVRRRLSGRPSALADAPLADQALADWTPTNARSRVKIAIAGALIGFMVGLTSVGSGSLVAMLLLFTSRLPVARLVGTDIAHAMLLVAGASLAHLQMGTVDLSLAGNLRLGSIPGVLIGGRLVGIAPSRPLKLGVCGLVFVAGLKMVA